MKLRTDVFKAAALRLRWIWRQRMGWVGAGGVAMAAAAVAAALAGQALQSQREALLRQHALRLDASVKMVSATPGPDPRDTAWLAIPVDAQRGAHLSTLLALLKRSRAEVTGAQYRLEDVEPGLRRLRVTLPVRGAYSSLRGLVVELLNGLPNAALDGFDVEREADSGTVSGRLRLSLFFRQEAK